MVINHNLSALNTVRQLGINTTATQKNLEKLSSGYRINRAGDDAAGLAISEKMRGQIRGLDQASRNSQDAISLIQTAEGALNETHSILQRMRELAVQSANDTNTTDDRDQIQKEIDQLTSEVNRIGNTTEFNTMKLLNGDKAIVSQNVSTPTSTTSIVNGTGGNVTLNYSAGLTYTVAADSTAWQKSIAGGIAVQDDSSADEAIDWSDADTTNAGDNQIVLTKVNAAGDLQIDLSALDSTAGTTFTYSTTLSADDMANAATSGKYTVNYHGVSFDLNLDEFSSASAGSSITLDLATATGISGSATDATGTYGLASDFAAAGHADFTTDAAVPFSIDPANSALVGIATLSVSLNAAGDTVTVTGKDAGGTAILNDQLVLGTALGDTDTFEYDENGIHFKFAAIDDGSGSDVSFATNDLDISKMVAQLKTTNGSTSSVNTVDNSLKMQIGANNGQAMSIDISDMRSKALGLSSGVANDSKTVKDSMGNNTTAKYVAVANVNKGTDNASIEYSLDVSSAENAAAAISVIDSSIASVSSERSKLGAFQNRLEHTINNLGAASENLTASESRIRDVDMAKEMMDFTKNNILSQAAQAMLAQANQQPQGVLQLLR